MKLFDKEQRSNTNNNNNTIQKVCIYAWRNGEDKISALDNDDTGSITIAQDAVLHFGRRHTDSNRLGSAVHRMVC